MDLGACESVAVLQWLDRFSLDAVELASSQFSETVAKHSSYLPLRIIRSVTVSRVDTGYWTLVEGGCSASRFFAFDSDTAVEALHGVLKLCSHGSIAFLRIVGHHRNFELDNESSLVLHQIASNIPVKETTFHNVPNADETLQSVIGMTKGLESLDLAWRTVRVTDAFLNSLLLKDVGEVRIADAEVLTGDAILRFCLGSSAVASSTGVRAMDLNCLGFSAMFFDKLIQAFLDDTSATPIALMVATDDNFDLSPYAPFTRAYRIGSGQGLRYVFDAAKHPFELRVDGDRIKSTATAPAIR